MGRGHYGYLYRRWCFGFLRCLKGEAQASPLIFCYASFELAYGGHIGQNLDLSTISRKFYNYLSISCGHVFSHNRHLSGSMPEVLSRIPPLDIHMRFFCSIQRLLPSSLLSRNPIWPFLAQSSQIFYLVKFPLLRCSEQIGKLRFPVKTCSQIQ